MPPDSTGPRDREGDPAAEDCPFCEFSGPRIVVYQHVDDDHPGIDPDDVFSDRLGLD